MSSKDDRRRKRKLTGYRRTRSQPRGEQPESGIKALMELVVPKGLIQVPGFKDRVPVLEPKVDFRSSEFDHMKFDGAVCRAGLKTFIRPLTPDDQPKPEFQISGPPLNEEHRLGGSYVLVQEIVPGERSRCSIEVYFSDSADAKAYRDIVRERVNLNQNPTEQ